MQAEIIKQMRDEEAALLRKLDAVRTFLAAYGESAVTPDTPSARKGMSVIAGRRAREKVSITSFTVQTRQSVLLSLEAMIHAPGLVKTSDLVDYMHKRGHEISGGNKVNALGALLARSEDVKGYGKSGWTVQDRDRALAILNEHLYKEKGPHSVNAGGPETAPYALTEEAVE
jgi:hypothetical protein